MLTKRSAVLKKHLGRFEKGLNRALKGDVRALHQTRVTSRRLRELVPLLELGGDASRKLNRRLRKVTKRLGSIRELDVMLLLIDELRVSGRGGQPLSRVAVAVSKERDDARKRQLGRIRVDEMRRVVRKLARRAEDLRQSGNAAPASSADTWRTALETRIAHRAARLGAAIDEAGSVYLPERLHDVRIALKKLRYSLELSGETGRDHAADVRTLKRAQDTLGRLHDLQVLIDRVRQVQASLTPPGIVIWRAFDRLEMALEDDCRQLHARYMRLRDRIQAIAARVTPTVASSRHQTPSSDQRRVDAARDAADVDRQPRRSIAV